mmetsp:Transcript_20100/g.40390  ORF Transcript_20100/g.40390 Transcript_20100/m.40390 type:complete len:498 (+) Transcript_20100:35-1528(+)
MNSDIALHLLFFCLHLHFAVTDAFSPVFSRSCNGHALCPITTAIAFPSGVRHSSRSSCCSIDGSDAVNPIDRDADKFGLDVSSSEAFKAHELPEYRLVVFGLGNVGTLVAKSASTASARDGEKFFKQVYGTVRRKRDKEKDHGKQNASENAVGSSGGSINTICADTIDDIQVIEFASHEELATLLPSCTHVLVTIPPINSLKWNGEDSFRDMTTDTEYTTKSNATKETIFVGGKPREWPREWKICCDPVFNHPRLSLAELIQPNTWVGYVSSTSVYGNHDGESVNETSPINCEPGSKGELYFRAETEWRNAAEKFGWKLNVFRCAGLYGDGRSALHTLRKKMMKRDYVSLDCEEFGMGNEKERGEKEYPTSRIHEEDVTRAILGSMMKLNELDSLSCNTWNLSDDYPAPRSEVMTFAAKIIKEESTMLLRDPANFQKTTSSTMPVKSERALRRKTDRKRVNNRLAKQMLMPNGILLYPTYREGLQAVMKSNKLNGNW